MLAVLRANAAPMRPRDIIEQVQGYSPDVGATVIYNMGPRLKGDLIDTSSDGWTLRHPEQAPLVTNGYLWGLPASLAVHEVAAFRRHGILHILKFFDSGLELLQLVEWLKKCQQWVKAPVNKDLVKADIAELAEAGKIKRRGNTRKPGRPPSFRGVTAIPGSRGGALTNTQAACDACVLLSMRRMSLKLVLLTGLYIPRARC
jgi:hypothetical protein